MEAASACIGMFLRCDSILFFTMNAKLKVSVVMPIYNAEVYLRECLQSVCRQTLQEVEIICVNDGSTDGSASILDEYAAKNNQIIVIHQKNSGQAVARNLALDVATGDWVMGLDSDDSVAPHTLEKLSCHMLEDVDIICYGISSRIISL